MLVPSRFPKLNQPTRTRRLCHCSSQFIFKPDLQRQSASSLLENVAMSQLAKVKSKAREPPSLFLPPSPSASHASLSATTGPGPGHQSGPGPSSSLGPGRGGASLLPSPTVNDTRRASVAAAAAAAAAANAATTTTGSTSPNPATALNLSIPLQLPRGESTRTTDRTDALWAEMQATLEEVELSASGGTRVFGPDHEQKLAELRQAQIALAQAWARSEADDAVETQNNGGAASVVGGGLGKTKSSVAGTEYGGGLGGKSEAGGTIGGTEGGGPKSTGGAGSTRPNSAGGPEKLGAKLEQETDADILLARKRREANDHYFSRVNQGVLDVVAKLEDVAVAMRAVEQESKDIWADGEDDSNPGSVRANV